MFYSVINRFYKGYSRNRDLKLLENINAWVANYFCKFKNFAFTVVDLYTKFFNLLA